MTGTTICGLYLGFCGVRKCVDALKAIAIRTSDVSVLLRDGSLISAMPLTTGHQKSEGDIAGGNGQYTGSLASSRAPVERTLSRSLTRTLLSLGIPVYDSERIEERISNGGILVLVRCYDFAAIEKVKDVLVATEAQDISCARRPALELQSCAAPHTTPELPRAAHA